MQFSVTKEENDYLVDITIPKGIVEKEMDSIAKAIQPQAQLKGFRKGNVPLDVIKGQYKNAIKGEASTRLLYDAISKALRENNIKNAGNPVLLEEYRPTKTRPFVGLFGLDGTLKFKVKVEAPPEVDVKDYKNVEVEINTSNYDSWIKAELVKNQMLFGEKTQVNRKSKVGDEIVADFSGTLDGNTFDGGTFNDYIFTLGQGGFIPGFEDGFIDREPGEQFTVRVTFPTDYLQQSLAGKEVDFACTLKEVHEVVPHPLNDDLALMLSYGSVDEMMQSLKDSWEQEFEKPVKSETFNAIMNKVIDANPFNVPENWVNQEIQMTMARMGLKAHQIEGNEGLEKSLREISERSVRISYLLDRIYEKEPDIHLTVEEIQSIADGEGGQVGKTGMEYLDELRRAGRYETYIAFQEQQKAIKFLLDNAVVTEKKEVENESK